MRLIIAGSRHFTNSTYRGLLRLGLQMIVENDEDVTVLSGLAPGPDSYGVSLAEQFGLALERHPARWNVHGKAAGPIRNQQMVDNADALLLLWDGKSRGSADVKRKALKGGLHVLEIMVREHPSPDEGTEGE